MKFPSQLNEPLKNHPYWYEKHEQANSPSPDCSSRSTKQIVPDQTAPQGTILCLRMFFLSEYPKLRGTILAFTRAHLYCQDEYRTVNMQVLSVNINFAGLLGLIWIQTV